MVDQGPGDVRPFEQNVIAIIWDFDRTLIPGYMQEPIFQHFGVDGRQFWQEVNALPDRYRDSGMHHVAEDSVYLNHLLTYVQAGRFPGLNNAMLRELGARLQPAPGVPEFFQSSRDHVRREPAYQAHDLKLEHYVISTGLRPMIEGSPIGAAVDDIWACEFIEDQPPPGYLDASTTPRDAAPGAGEPAADPILRGVGYVIDNTTKTRAVFEINKGSNRHPVDVNAAIPREARRVPFEHMIYVADGPSDVPVFSLVRQQGGRAIAVYTRGRGAEFAQVKQLQVDGRVDFFAEADYCDGSPAAMWLTDEIDRIARRYIARKAEALHRSVGAAPRHLVD